MLKEPRSGIFFLFKHVIAFESAATIAASYLFRDRDGSAVMVAYRLKITAGVQTSDKEHLKISPYDIYLLSD